MANRGLQLAKGQIQKQSSLLLVTCMKSSGLQRILLFFKSQDLLSTCLSQSQSMWKTHSWPCPRHSQLNRSWQGQGITEALLGPYRSTKTCWRTQGPFVEDLWGSRLEIKLYWPPMTYLFLPDLPPTSLIKFEQRHVINNITKDHMLHY